MKHLPASSPSLVSLRCITSVIPPPPLEAPEAGAGQRALRVENWDVWHAAARVMGGNQRGALLFTGHFFCFVFFKRILLNLVRLTRQRDFI